MCVASSTFVCAAFGCARQDDTRPQQKTRSTHGMHALRERFPPASNWVAPFVLHCRHRGALFVLGGEAVDAALALDTILSGEMEQRSMPTAAGTPLLLSWSNKMAAFILIPGAGGAAWYWHRVVPLLRAARHEAIAVDLPGDDNQAGLSAYADRVVDAVGKQDDAVLVAQSLGGFTAPLVCERVPVRMLVFVNAMIPTPGETAGDWWDHTGAIAARNEAARQGGYGETFDLATYFLHDVPQDVIAEGAAHERPEAEIVFGEPCRFKAWPDVPTHAIVARDDRFFPLAFQERVAWERLGIDADVVPGGHLVALSDPRGLADKLLGYL
jgi:pimeloyl-ACP methyl ester carboxylesterase